MLPTGVHVIRKTENANKFIAEVMEFHLVTERLLFPIPGPTGVKLLRKFHLDFSYFRIFFFFFFFFCLIIKKIRIKLYCQKVFQLNIDSVLLVLGTS